MKLSKRLIFILTLALISLICPSCSIFRKAIYVPPGKAVEVRKPTLVPIWVRSKDNNKVFKAWVVAGEGWRLAPPPRWIQELDKEINSGN